MTEPGQSDIEHRSLRDFTQELALVVSWAVDYIYDVNHARAVHPRTGWLLEQAREHGFATDWQGKL